MDSFDKRIELLNKSSETPEHEITAAVNIHERMLTAKEICSAALGLGAASKYEYIIPVFKALCDEAKLLTETA